MKWNQANKAEHMTTLSELKMMKQQFDLWFNSTDTIYTAYNNPSHAKIEAYEYFKEKAYNLYKHVTGFNVISHNTFVFTIGYEFADNETGEINFMYVTPTYSRYCHISDLDIL